MKMNIQITKPNRYNEEEKIIDIDLSNGHWKYWDDYMECNDTEKVSLTMNNIRLARYLSLPVKDAYGFCDHDLLKNENKFQITDAMVRTYDSLHEYLVARIDNAKEEYNGGCWDIMSYHEKGIKFTAVLFEEQFKKSADDTVVADINYEVESLITVTIKVID